ncbi:class A basic helix-loop-helix protein 15-like [Pollicipes pollicipes]|uniref:class A basic helix-loop-helix protein 15-like n=1 Tax=Pollicipes pollicipes TaxID=41117 RepID=UPI0018857BA5|nr:class A basic helix-loop-helix protein 15-like [Pollicipes pollicipes]
MTAGDAKSDAVVCVGQMGSGSDERSDCRIELGGAGHDRPPLAAGQSKYSLRARSILKRLETETRQLEPKVRPPKQKSRPPALSKYRRKTANTRERDRMRDINRAFETLERAVPELAGSPTKVTKITVLRLAIDYIKAMRTMLEPEAGGVERDAPNEVFSPSPSTSSVLTDASSELPDPLDTIEDLTDFQLPGGLDLLLDIRSDSDALDFSCSDFSDLPSP